MVEREANRINVMTPLMNTRVLKANVDAVENCLDEAIAILKVSGNRRAFAELVALVAITATDAKPSYTAIVVEGNHSFFFGPFKTGKAARTALQKGLVGTHENSKGYIAPLIPAPKLVYSGKYNWEIVDKEWHND